MKMIVKIIIDPFNRDIFIKFIEDSTNISDTLWIFLRSCLQNNPENRPKITDPSFCSFVKSKLFQKYENKFEEFKINEIE